MGIVVCTNWHRSPCVELFSHNRHPCSFVCQTANCGISLNLQAFVIVFVSKDPCTGQAVSQGKGIGTLNPTNTMPPPLQFISVPRNPLQPNGNNTGRGTAIPFFCFLDVSNIFFGRCAWNLPFFFKVNFEHFWNVLHEQHHDVLFIVTAADDEQHIMLLFISNMNSFEKKRSISSTFGNVLHEQHHGSEPFLSRLTHYPAWGKMCTIHRCSWGDLWMLTVPPFETVCPWGSLWAPGY